MLSILFIIIMMVVTAGCSSKGNEDEAANAAAQIEDVTASMSPGQLDHYNYQQQLKAKGSYFDPELDGISITTMDPDLVVVRKELSDRRLEESSDDFDVKATIVNNGEEPVWVSRTMSTAQNRYIIFGDYVASGERMSVSWDRRLGQKVSDVPDHLIVVSGAKTTVPSVAPEYTAFGGMVICDLSGTDAIDVQRIDFVVKNQEKGWESAILQVSSKKDMEHVGFVLEPMQHVYVNLKAGEVRSIEVPFQGKSASKVDRLRIIC